MTDLRSMTTGEVDAWRAGWDAARKAAAKRVDAIPQTYHTWPIVASVRAEAAAIRAMEPEGAAMTGPSHMTVSDRIITAPGMVPTRRSDGAALPLLASWTAEQVREFFFARHSGDTKRCVQMLRDAGWKVRPAMRSDGKVEAGDG